MRLLAPLAVGLVAAAHFYFLVLEMFLWKTPYGRRTFGTTMDQAESSATLAANQGLYNGFLATGLCWGLWLGIAPGRAVLTFFLACIVIAGLYGAYSVKRTILFVQAMPAAVALALVWLLGAGCSGPAASGTTAAETGTVATAAASTAAPATAAAAGARCLPVVSKECGCVWDCAAGVSAGGDKWIVRPAFWRGAELRARIDRWCVGPDCTDAFDVELDACDSKCVPRPADATCRFEGDRCVGAASR
ncbi:MAG TPA: DUF1304 domain-containing protein [Myxococcota bacterium]|jgi:putative membrane protein|nr:DUF1304 domain-containing protein [Myxococcota bacterium]